MWLFVFISTLLVIFESLMTQLFSFWQAQAQDGQGVMISLQKDEKETQHLGFAEATSCEYVHFTLRHCKGKLKARRYELKWY